MRLFVGDDWACSGRVGLAWLEVALEVGGPRRGDQEADRAAGRTVGDHARDQGLIGLARGLLTKCTPAYERRNLRPAAAREDRAGVECAVGSGWVDAERNSNHGERGTCCCITVVRTKATQSW